MGVQQQIHGGIVAPILFPSSFQWRDMPRTKFRWSDHMKNHWDKLSQFTDLHVMEMDNL